MRIGFFYRDFLRPGGMPQETRYLAEALSRRGHEVLVYSYGEKPGSRRKAGFQVDAFRGPRISWSTSPDLRQVLSTNEDRLKVLFLIGGHIPENFGVSRASKAGRIPYIVSVGEAYNPYNLARRKLTKWAWKQLFESRILQDALAIRCYSRENIKQLEVYHPGLECFILREGVHAFDPAQIDHSPFDSGYTNLLFLGRISVWKKGIDQLVKAVTRLAPRYPDLRLHLVGPIEREELSRFQELCESVPGDILRYHGAIYSKEKYAYLAGADLFVHPSRHEGIPRSIREAMGVGTPLVVTPETNVAEDVEHYRAGFVVSCDVEGIAAGIEAYLEHPHRERLRRNTLRMAAELYDWDVIAGELERELEAWNAEGLLD